MKDDGQKLTIQTPLRKLKTALLQSSRGTQLNKIIYYLPYILPCEYI